MFILVRVAVVVAGFLLAILHYDMTVLSFLLALAALGTGTAWWVWGGSSLLTLAITFGLWSGVRFGGWLSEYAGKGRG